MINTKQLAPRRLVIMGRLVAVLAITALFFQALVALSFPAGAVAAAEDAGQLAFAHDAAEHMLMGNPSGATTDVNNPTNYLMQKLQYALSYHRDRGTPNWVSWHLDNTWLGGAQRQDDYRPDTTLPIGWYHVQDTDYQGSGFDRGHMTPSADRTSSIADNSATFLMTNMIPQSPDNNRGPWAALEEYSRVLVDQGNELYIISGPAGTGGQGSNGGTTNTIAGGRVTVPQKTWKVILVLPVGDNDVSRVNASTRAIAIIMPNAQGINNDAWQKYLATVDQVEALTGYDFFSNVPASVQSAIESRLDSQNNNAPQAQGQSVVTSFNTPLNITLAATDINVNNALSYTVVANPAHGTLSGTPPNLVYTPAANYSGPDSFTFRATDGTAVSNVATVNITVNGPTTPTPTPTPAPTPPGDTWLPVALATEQVEIQTWKQADGKTYAKVKLTFPDAGYRVQDQNWGSVQASGNNFSASATVERYQGTSVQAETTTVHIYDLGLLPAGSYTFSFRTFNMVTKTHSFTVSDQPPAPNPLDNQEFFVAQQYRDFLGREPDSPGLAFWTANITKCNDPAQRQPGQTFEQCIDRQRETTSAAFFLSPEFQYTGYFVYRMYKGALGRAPYLSEFTPDRAIVGQGIIVNDQLSGQKINENKLALAEMFVQRAEFLAIYGSLTNQDYVNKLFQTTNVAVSDADKQALVNGLNSGGETRASVLLKVVDGINVISEGNQQFTTAYGQAFYNREFNNAFVQMEYFGYMRRDPDAPGYAFWLGKLNTFGNYVDAEMVRSFVVSPEYRSRFGAP